MLHAIAGAPPEATGTHIDRDAPLAVPRAGPPANHFSLDAAASWTLRTASGLRVHVPDRLASITTYVLLEQERWFESEFGFVERLLEPHACALDIGANHGVYALALACALPRCRVIAFEPTHEPRSRLLRSILDNGLADCIAVAPLGLSDSAREVPFNVSSESELNSMHGTGERAERIERVQLERLDAFLARHPLPRGIDFVKLDAEGEELAVLRGGDHFFRTESPIVMFELVHASSIQPELPAAFEALGYGIYRHLPGLGVLAPWLTHSPAADVPLNLFAIKPERASVLAGRGLLAGSSANVVNAASGEGSERLSEADHESCRAWLSGRPCFANATAAECRPWPTDEVVSSALGLLVAAHANKRLSATARLQAAHAAVERLTPFWSTSAGGIELALPPLATLATLIHALRLVGRRKAALGLAQHALRVWPRDATVDGLFMPPEQADLERPCSTAPAEWLRLVLAEFVERQRAFSSYFAPVDPLQLRSLLRHPDHSAEMERRYALHELRHNRAPDPALLPKLAAGSGSMNVALWQAVLRASV